MIDRVPRDRALAAWAQLRLEHAIACDAAQTDAGVDAPVVPEIELPSPAAPSGSDPDPDGFVPRSDKLPYVHR